MDTSSSSKKQEEEDNNNNDDDKNKNKDKNKKNDEKKEAELPPGWTKGFSKSQKRHYYVHAATKHTQWNFPTVSQVASRQRDDSKGDDGGSGSSSTTLALGAQKRQRFNNEINDDKNGDGNEAQQPKEEEEEEKQGAKRQKASDPISVAIIVPYRDLHPAQQRAKHLARFVPYMQHYLGQMVQEGSLSRFHIYICEQSNDGRKFNRGKLLNIGFQEAAASGNDFDSYIFHDVDLLPQNDVKEWYAQYPTRPLHIARVWNRYSNNPKYFGGIVAFGAQDMKRLNGYPNNFWGWGGEDDELQKRCEANRLQWDFPKAGTIVDLEEMDLQKKLQFLRENREWKCMVKWEALEEHASTWRTNGLADLQYQVLKSQSMDDSNTATRLTLDVQLNGNHWSNEKCSVDYVANFDNNKNNNNKKKKQYHSSKRNYSQRR